MPQIRFSSCENTIAKIKDQENPNFTAFGTSANLSNDPLFDPGRLGKRSDGTKIHDFQPNSSEFSQLLQAFCKTLLTSWLPQRFALYCYYLENFGMKWMQDHLRTIMYNF